MGDYVKGEKPRDLEGACGGLVIERLQSFAKDPDDYHPLGTGLSGPENTQNYIKKTKDPRAKQKGDTKAGKKSFA